jgi:5-methyltetrahydrofolate--homocysteine methyltransferase
VTDLGKDVPNERIIEAVKRLRPDILCLSSLLTTTMNEMKVISSQLRESGLPVRLMVGGAVVTAEYAGGIGAHYAEDAVAAAAAAIEIMKG